MLPTIRCSGYISDVAATSTRSMRPSRLRELAPLIVVAREVLEEGIGGGGASRVLFSLPRDPALLEPRRSAPYPPVRRGTGPRDVHAESLRRRGAGAPLRPGTHHCSPFRLAVARRGLRLEDPRRQADRPDS